jgi:hypothetical protein
VRQLAPALVLPMVTVLFAGCTRGDFATVTIEYHRPAPGALTLEPPEKQRVTAAFTRVAKEMSYQCRPHVKRIEEVRCRGPKKMNITFQPELNRPLYVAKFNWLESDYRTRAEFDRHVAGFVQSLRLAIADPDIKISTSKE